MIQARQIADLEVFSSVPTTKTKRPPVLFIHGAFAGAWMWTETFMPYLAAAGIPCYALSLRGHGGSKGLEHISGYAISDYAEDVRKVSEWLGEPPILVGHSMGGFIAQKYVEHHEAKGVALVCSVPPQGLMAAQFHLLLQKPQMFLDLNRIMSGHCPDTTMLKEALFAGEVDEAMLEIWLHRLQPESHRALWDMSMFNLPGLIARQHPPMLILGAEKDVLVPAFLVQSTAQTYGLPAHIFRNMGHALTHEKEWPLVAATLETWLNSLTL